MNQRQIYNKFLESIRNKFIINIKPLKPHYSSESERLRNLPKKYPTEIPNKNVLNHIKNLTLSEWITIIIGIISLILMTIFY